MYVYVYLCVLVWVLQLCMCMCVGKMLQGAAGGKGASLKLPALFFGFMKNLNTHTKMAERSEAACSEQVASDKQHVACNNKKDTLQALHEPPGKGAAQITRQTRARGMGTDSAHNGPSWAANQTAAKALN